MGGLKFLITLFVIYLIFRAIMRKVLSAVNSDTGGALKGKLGNVIETMKREMEKAKLEAEREAAGVDEEMILRDDPWAELRDDEEDEEDLFIGDGFFRKERVEEEAAVRGSSHERWNEVDETPALWDRPEVEDAPRVARSRGEVPHRPQGSCRTRRKRRMRLKEAIMWKEILDPPVGLRS
jgi:hypothetical protein